MNRISLECANCKGKDFEVEVSCVPTGISICCNKCGCITPLLVLSEMISKVNSNHVLPINGKASADLYDEAYHENVSTDMIREAYEKDTLRR
ncbi:hypothetical protein [Cuneatibacter caecimuris]|uniref:Uncharacterized protein n=1 Tax=Cuneatibacter caecimuris TaxID=1796618 RepID=A0A4V2F7W0_9FIRM|nr:hypothetical protein [Cuneatibacter caecimuris]RZT01199.1 hypothetical protein EV209_1642 [Cuneatibacter caecimuris]